MASCLPRRGRAARPIATNCCIRFLSGVTVHVRWMLGCRAGWRQKGMGMLERGTKGDTVRALQRALVALGYELPRWGIDGDLGTETIDVIAQFLRDHGIEVTDDADVISDEQIALLESVSGKVIEAPLGPR